ncbi:MAG TPA: nucleotide pyrophosphohydrolase, partial [Bdellovibrionales bacterium]|nr:nucleotide pyrophosphohydrolase [Bdellovibrionales bacterium]
MPKHTDSETPLNELKEIVRKFCEERDWDQFHSPKELAIGVSTEGSELLELFRFKSDEEVMQIVEKTKREQVGEELADVLYFVVRFAQKFGFDLTAEFHKKMAKNSAKYPVSKAKGSNKKYSE